MQHSGQGQVAALAFPQVLQVTHPSCRRRRLIEARQLVGQLQNSRTQLEHHQERQYCLSMAPARATTSMHAASRGRQQRKEAGSGHTFLFSDLCHRPQHATLESSLVCIDAPWALSPAAIGGSTCPAPARAPGSIAEHHARTGYYRHKNHSSGRERGLLPVRSRPPLALKCAAPAR